MALSYPVACLKTTPSTPVANCVVIVGADKFDDKETGASLPNRFKKIQDEMNLPPAR
jgi:hypothetical protein